MRSRTVSTSSHYEIDITSHGIHLTQLTNQEMADIINKNTFSHWTYLVCGSYLEGNNYNDLIKRKELLNSLTIPGSIIVDGINIEPGTIISINPNPISKPTSDIHICIDFKFYQGLVESYEYCIICDKKR